MSRVAIGNPDILDLTVISSEELLLQAKSVGTTTLLVWDDQGQRTFTIQVVDRALEGTEAQLRRLLTQIYVPGIQVKREDRSLFLTGQVEGQEQLDQIEKVLSAYPGVTSLVSVAPAPAPAPAAPPQSVKLTVKIVELTRKDLEKLGVKWSESVALTEPQATDLTLQKGLFRWGTSLTRGSVSATLNALVQRNRARILSEPKLVTTSGKEASSFIGLEVPVITATSFSTTTSAVGASVEFRKTGVLLKMTPNVIALDGQQKITTVIEAEVSAVDDSVAINVPVGSQTVKVTGFRVRKANTEVTTSSGETIMIAGLLAVDDSKTVDQVPGLGSVPVFGRLFRSPEMTSNERELVIVVTPELLVEPESPSEKMAAVEQALAVAEVTATASDPTLQYALQVHDRIAKAIRYPTQDREEGKSGRVTLRLHLLKDGTLGEAVIAEPSGIEPFDQEVLRAAQRQAPYPPFPPDVAKPDLWLELPILFRQ